MKAAVFHDPGKIEVRSDVADPRPGHGEVLVRVRACGICGSDLHLYRTNAHRDGGGVLRVNEQGFEIPGHEYSGVIESVGPAVDGFAPGDRVVGVTGGGAFAELVAVPVNPYQIARIPEGVSFEEAATTEPMADALQIVRLAEIRPDENVVVFGVGIIGLGVIQALGSLPKPAGRIIAVDVSDARLAMARKLGATHAVNSRATPDLVHTVGEICGVLPNLLHGGEAPDVGAVLDCAGYLKHMTGPVPLQSAIDMLTPAGGRIVCFGAYEGPFTIDFEQVIAKQIRIIGSLGYQPRELTRALELMAEKKVDRGRLITDHFPLDQITEAFETQGRGQAIKVMVHPQANR